MATKVTLKILVDTYDTEYRHYRIHSRKSLKRQEQYHNKPSAGGRRYDFQSFNNIISNVQISFLIMRPENYSPYIGKTAISIN